MQAFVHLALATLIVTASAACGKSNSATPPTETAGDDAASNQPGPSGPSAGAPVFQCGAESCTADQLCEERRKGHAVDVQHRPLHKKKCMPLPAPCQARPTCECVAAHVSVRHCYEDNGQVRIDDYPR